MTQTFTQQYLASRAPWDDPAGSWAALGTAKAAMAEQVFGIVSAQGTPDCPTIGILTAPLSTTGTVSSITVGGINQALSAAELVMVVAPGGQQWQNFYTSGTATAGSSTVNVTATAANYSYPAGSFLCLGYTAGWSTLLDPVACSQLFPQFLPYVSQFNGTGVPATTDPTDALSIIQQEAGFQRGTPASMVAAAQRFLTGSQSCVMLERTPDAYSVTMVMRPEQVTNQTPLQNAVLAVKPAGIVVDFVYMDGFIFNEAIHTFTADALSWNATASTQP